MTLSFSVNGAHAVPAYEQLRSQLAGAIYAGTAAPGERLPPARELAAELSLAVNTVTRAYGELARAGLIESRRRFGTAVVADPPIVPSAIQAAATRLTVRARSAGISSEQVIDLVRAATTTADTPPAG